MPLAETNGEAVCPRCRPHETYKITTRRKFQCARHGRTSF